MGILCLTMHPSSHLVSKSHATSDQRSAVTLTPILCEEEH